MKEGTHSNNNIFISSGVAEFRKQHNLATQEWSLNGDIVENIERGFVNVSKLSKSASFDRSRSEQKHMAPGMQRNRN